MKTLTREEAYKVMIDGEKVEHPLYQKGAYCDYSDRSGHFMYNNEAGDRSRVSAAMEYAGGYTIYKEKIKKWVNIYSKGKTVVLHNTRAEANEVSMDTRIACIEIEYCEGEGLK